MKRRIISISTSLLLAAAIFAGCGGKRTIYDSLYADLSEDLTASDPSVLTGRRIVIDPGHGGEYDGVIGAGSLSEAEVNLGVALYLWGLLREEGAEVHLTRSSDRDFLPEGASEPGADLGALLRNDLAGRIEKANEFEPEVFISIHHNSNIALDRERNGIEVYYRGTDHGASLELATDLHTHLARNLGIAASTIKTGNYFVLRNSEAGAAVLGEASYLSNPGVEDKLRLSAKQKLEAEAYFLGLVEYFSRGVPVITMTGPEVERLSAPARFEFTVKGVADIPVDPSSFEVKINGRRIDCFNPADGGDPFCLMPESMPNGPFTISFSARSEKGATSTYGPKEILLDRPARFFLPMEPVTRPDGKKYLKALVLDAGGRPVMNNKPVFITGPGEERKQPVLTKDGIVRFIRKNGTGPFIFSSDQAVDTLTFHTEGPENRMFAMVMDDLTEKPIPYAILRFADGNTATGNARGQIISTYADTAEAVLYVPGYEPAALKQRVAGDVVALPVTRMTPLYEGILHGKKIIIDPAGGGTDDAGRGAGALRGATVNMRLAKELEKMLIEAGARVHVTRKGEEQLSGQQRIFRVNRFAADLAVGLRFGNAAEPDNVCTVYHYPGSISGTAAADSLASGITGTPPCESFITAGSSDLFLQQTNCPAVVISGGCLSDPDMEMILGSFRWIRLEAEAILRGLLGHFSAED